MKRQRKHLGFLAVMPVNCNGAKSGIVFGSGGGAVGHHHRAFFHGVAWLEVCASRSPRNRCSASSCFCRLCPLRSLSCYPPCCQTRSWVLPPRIIFKTHQLLFPFSLCQRLPCFNLDPDVLANRC